MDYWSLKRKNPGPPLWWSLDGRSSANVLAAYTFTNRNSASDALKDLTGHGYHLTNNNATWSSSGGFWTCVNESRYLDNSSLRNAGIKSVVMKLSNAWNANGNPLTGGWGGASVWLKMPFEVQSFWPYHYGFGVAHSNGLSVDYESPYGTQGTLARANTRINGTSPSSGVIGFTNSGWGSLYLNGSSVSLSDAYGSGSSYSGPWTRYYASGIPRLIGGTGTEAQGCTIQGTFTIRGMAVYSKELSASEHAAIAARMKFV